MDKPSDKCAKEPEGHEEGNDFIVDHCLMLFVWIFVEYVYTESNETRPGVVKGWESRDFLCFEIEEKHDDRNKDSASSDPASIAKS